MPSSPLVTVAITFPLASVNVNSALETALPLIPSTFFTQKPAKGMRAQTVLDSFTEGDSVVMKPKELFASSHVSVPDVWSCEVFSCSFAIDASSS